MLDVLLGGVTGLIGTVWGGYLKLKQQKLEMEHEREMLKAERELMLAEAEVNLKITQAQVEGEIQLADAKAYEVSQKVGNEKLFGSDWIDRLLAVEGKLSSLAVFTAVFAAMLFALVDFWRAAMRPGLTMYLCGVTTWVTLMAWKIMQAANIQITAAQAVVIFGDVTHTVTYLTTSSVTWWFGDRATSKALAKRLDKGAA
ncbi:MAG: hypothetical protein AB7E47_12900 [Desulfovibrionaceae bacterium]